MVDMIHESRALLWLLLALIITALIVLLFVSNVSPLLGGRIYTTPTPTPTLYELCMVGCFQNWEECLDDAWACGHDYDVCKAWCQPKESNTV